MILERLVVAVDTDVSGLSRGMRQAAGEVSGSFNIIHRDFSKVEEGATRSHVSVGKLRQELVTVARQMTGLSPVAAQLGTILSEMAVGGLATVGVVAGVALIGSALSESRRHWVEYSEAVGDAVAKLKEAGNEAAFQGTFALQQRMAGGRARQELLFEQMQPFLKSAARPEMSDLARGNIVRDQLMPLMTEWQEIQAGLEATAKEISKTLSHTADGGLTIQAPKVDVTTDDIFAGLKRGPVSQQESQALVAELMANAAARVAGGVAAPGMAPGTTSAFVNPNPGTPGGPSKLSEIFGSLKGFAKSIGGVMKALNPLSILGDAISEALGDFLTNMTPIIELIAKALMPILEALFPVFKQLFIGATYVGQVFFKLTGWLQKAIGELLKGLGKAINFLLPGNPANGLVKAGQGMIDLGQGFLDASDELGKARDEIKGMEWKEAGDKAIEALSNIPEGMKLAAIRFDATRGVSRASSGTASTRGVQQTFTGNIILPGVRTATDFFRAMQREAQRDSASGGYGLAFGET